jgi:HEPN domain-containing protein
MKELVKGWFFYADKDIAIASELMNNPDLTNGVAFHCQQAIEKYLKAFIVEHDVKFLKVHDLVRLYELTQGVKDLALDLEKLREITEVYTDERYPGDIGLLPNGIPTEEEAHSFFEFAKHVEAVIKGELQGEDSCSGE